jgi:hypothetical protein
MVAIWGGKETSCFFRRGGFVPLSVVPLFESSDVDGSLANGEACKSSDVHGAGTFTRDQNFLFSCSGCVDPPEFCSSEHIFA